MKNCIKTASRVTVRSNVALIVVSSLLTACSGAAVPFIASLASTAIHREWFPVEEMDSGARIGVVSMLPDDVNLTYTGHTVFRTRRSKDGVPQWQINDFASGAAVASLASLRNYHAGTLQDPGFGPPVAARPSSYVALLANAERQRFDALIVIRPFDDPMPDYFAGGYGLLVNTGTWTGYGGVSCAYSWVVMDVWSVATKDLLGRGQARTCNNDKSIEVLDSMSAYSTTEKQQIERKIKASVHQSIRSAIRELELH